MDPRQLTLDGDDLQSLVESEGWNRIKPVVQVTDEDYCRWAAEYELTLPPLAPEPPVADETEPDPYPPW